MTRSGHRDNVLYAYDAPVAMGAASVTGTADGTSMTEEFIGGDSSLVPSAPLWSSITPTLPVGLSSASLTATSTLGSSVQIPETVWASGENMTVSFTIKSGADSWSVNRSSCTVQAGKTCTPELTFRPSGNGTTDGVLAVAGPNGTRDVTLDGKTPPPAVTGLSPSSGAAVGAAAVTLSGSGFAGATAVTFGTSAASFTVVSDTRIVATAPAGSGTVDIRVATPGGLTPTTAADRFTYVPSPPKDAYQPLVPARILNKDTLIAGHDQDIPILGTDGIPTTNVDAIAINVLIQNPTKTGWLRISGTGTNPPTATQQFTAGTRISNLALTKLGTDGKIHLHLSTGQTLIYLDIEGYYSPTAPDAYQPLVPARILNKDTLIAGHDQDIPILGTDGIPTTNVDAIAINVLIQNPTKTGWLRISGTGTNPPTATQQFTAGTQISNLALTKLGTDGKIHLHLSTGQTLIYLDLEGYYSPG